MAARWRRRNDDIRTTDEDAVSGRPAGLSASRAPPSPASSGSRAAGGRGRHPSTEQLGPISPWIEPPPLDDNCARYILSVMILFLRQAAPPHHRLMSTSGTHYNASYHDLESIEASDSMPSSDPFRIGPEVPSEVVFSNPEEAKHNLPSLMRRGSPDASTRHSHTDLPQHSTTYEHTSTVICNSTSSLNSMVAKFSGRIVYHLSASNWPVVFLRMKSKIHVLASESEEDQDVMDVRLMMHCCLDRVRLVQLLQGTCRLYILTLRLVS